MWLNEYAEAQWDNELECFICQVEQNETLAEPFGNLGHTAQTQPVQGEIQHVEELGYPMASPTAHAPGDFGCLEEHQSVCSLSESELSGVSKLPDKARGLLASARHEARRRGEAPANRCDEVEDTARTAEQFGWHVVGKGNKTANLFKFGQYPNSGFGGPP